MILEILDELGNPQVVRATRVVVSGDGGSPLLAVAIGRAPGSYLVKRADDPDFNATLRRLGIDRTVVLDSVRLRSIDEQLRRT